MAKAAEASSQIDSVTDHVEEKEMLFPGITEDGEETPLMKLKRPQEARLSSDASAELQAVKAGFAGSGRS